MSSKTRLGAVVLVVALAALTGAQVARADGDPASDVLYTDRVFFPYSVGTSKSARETLLSTVAASERAGYPIRVALIAGTADLGAVTVLWTKPRKYAAFLSLELSFVYTGPLLIVMPSGFGFAHYKQKTVREYAALSTVRVVAGQDGLATTAVNAVRVLAARSGHPIAGAGAASSRSTGSRYELPGAIALVLLALIAASGVVFWRRRRA
jgi:hypothetical protein